MYLGPRDKNTEVTDAEELQIVEAFAEAEEYLETSMVDDYYFDTEDQSIKTNVLITRDDLVFILLLFIFYIK